MSYPATCEICHDEKPFIRNLDDGKWYGINCAAKAGNDEAARIVMMNGALNAIEQAMMPPQELNGLEA